MSIPCIIDRPFPFFKALELKSLDLRFKVRGGRKPSGQVVIAGIEAKGIDAFGRWPWPRSVFAQLIVQLKDMGVKTIVFDLLFPEPEENRVAPALTSLIKNYKELGLATDTFQSQIFLDEVQQIIEASDNDKLMGDAMDWADNTVLGIVFEPGPPQKELPLSRIAIACYTGQGEKVSLSVANKKFLPPIQTFEAQARGLGFVNIFPDSDGIIRRVHPAISIGDNAFMPLSVSAAGHFLGETPKIDDNGKIHLKNVIIPGSEPLLLDFYGLENSFKGYSIADIIKGLIPPGDLKDKVVIIGGMATGIGDIWPTPLTGAIPGVFIQATFLDNILQNSILRKPPFENWLNVVCITVMILIILWLKTTLPPLVSTLAGLTCIAAYGLGAQYLFVSYLLVWPFVLPLTAGSLTLVVLLFLNLIIEGRQHQWIKKSFSQYLSKDVIDILVSA